MEEQKYFIPEICELFEGYEFEYQEYDEDKDEFKNNWIKSEFDSRAGLGDDLTYQFKEGTVRCEFLTKEQIESEGFQYRAGYRGEFVKTTLLEQWKLDYNFKNKTLYIEKGTRLEGDEDFYYPYEGANYVFVGKCKCINEFRKILKLLEIC